MSRIFRLRYGWKKGGASSSEWVYRESFESMVEELEHLLLQLDVYKALESRGQHRGVDGRRLALRVFSKRGRDKAPDTSWHVTKIYAVQEFIDGEWVDLEFEWVQPLLAVKGPVF
jgi:hypothetical protein